MAVKKSRGKVAAVFGLGCTAGFAYSNSFAGGFTLDSAFILGEDRVHAFTGENLALIWNHTYWWPNAESNLYRPFATLSFLVNYASFQNGSDPLGFHVVNLFLHVGAILLAYFAARRILGANSLALFTAAIWGVHPVLTESVTNIAGRADLLAGISILGGLLLYLISRETFGWRRTFTLISLAVLTIVGLASKESAAVLFPVLILYEIAWWDAGSIRRLGNAFSYVSLPFALFLFKRASVLTAGEPLYSAFVDNPLIGAGFWQARLTALKILALYLKLLVWPVSLSCDYSFAQIPLAVGTLSDWLCWLIVALTVGAAGMFFRKSRATFFFICFSFLTLTTTSNLGVIIGTIMGERFLYLPALGFAACVVLCLQWCTQRIRIPVMLPATVAALVLLFGFRTRARNRDWQTPLTLAEAAVRASPNSFKAHRMLAEALDEHDLTDSNLDRVITEGERGIAILEGLPNRLNSWQDYSETAGYHLRKGDLYKAASAGNSDSLTNSSAEWERSRFLLNRGIAIKRIWVPPPTASSPIPQNPIVAAQYRTLSKVYSRLRKPHEAYESAVEARRFDALDPQVATRLGESLLDLGRGRDAAQVFLEARMYSSDSELDSAMRALYASHSEYFDLPARCAALLEVNQRAIALGRRVKADDLTLECRGINPRK